MKIGEKIIVTCSNCGNQRTIVCRSISKPYTKLCKSCATTISHKNNPRVGREENHYNWKGGINVDRNGYVLEYVNKNNPFYQMAANTNGKRYGGYILQHRLVMAKHLGRCLKSWEIVHHINGNKQDNHIKNLQITERIKHKVTYQDGYRKGYKQAMLDNNKIWTGKDWITIKEVK